MFEKIICNGTVVHKISKKKPCYYQAVIPKLHLFVDFKALYCMFSYTPKNIQPDHILRTIFYSFLSGILMHYRSIVQSEPNSNLGFFKWIVNYLKLYTNIWQPLITANVYKHWNIYLLVKNASGPGHNVSKIYSFEKPTFCFGSLCSI